MIETHAGLQQSLKPCPQDERPTSYLIDDFYMANMYPDVIRGWTVDFRMMEYLLQRKQIRWCEGWEEH